MPRSHSYDWRFDPEQAPRGARVANANREHLPPRPLGTGPAVIMSRAALGCRLWWAQVMPCARYWEPSTLSIHANGSRISARVGRLSGASHARLSSLIP
jgi:hypothetical protein